MCAPTRSSETRSFSVFSKPSVSFSYRAATLLWSRRATVHNEQWLCEK